MTVTDPRGIDLSMRPHVRLSVVVAIGFVLTLVLVVVSFTSLGGVEGHLARIDAKLLPEQARLERVEARYEQGHAAVLSVQPTPDSTTLTPVQFDRIAASRDADSAGATAWSEYTLDAVGFPDESVWQTRFERARARYSDAQIQAITALIAGDVTNPSVRTYQAGYAGMRDALSHLQRFYAAAGREDTRAAHAGVATTRRFIIIEFAIGVVLFLTVFGIAFVSMRRREERLAVQAAHHERESQRSQLESDLQRAFEMVRSEEASYRIISEALAESIEHLDVELLVADSSRAHFRRVAGNTEPPRPGCPVGDPRECPATSRTQTMRFPRTADLATCPYLRDRPERPASAVCVPVTIAGKSVGVLHSMSNAPADLDSDAPDDLDSDDVDMLELIGHRSGDRLGTIRAFARTEAQARTDPLTGLLNRRSLENQVQELVEDGRPYIVAYGDIDHFKVLNDLHGHDTGDRALRLFARVLRDSVRPADIPARYGGEEFVVVLPECRIDDAVAVVERFRERLAIELSDGQIPPFTVSFGVDSSTGHHVFSEVVEAADAALLSAKAAGRNRVIAHRAPKASSPGLDTHRTARRLLHRGRGRRGQGLRHRGHRDELRPVSRRSNTVRTPSGVRSQEESMEFNLFLPQMRLSYDDLVARARAAEAAGFAGMTGMDHLAPPMAEAQPMYEAMVTTTWLAAHTRRMTLGSLVLCDTFRHPAVLARQAVSIDHASGGRFELGIGWGSVPEEIAAFGVGSTRPRDRVERLRESLEIIRALWTGERVDHAGEYFQLDQARQEPRPLARIPIVIGGVGPKTLGLVRDFADWWNVHVGQLGRIDELRPQIGNARVSIQQMVALVPRGGDREAVTATAEQRFGYARPRVGTGAELADHFSELRERGVERVYTWFCDFARPETLLEFGEEVIGPSAGLAR